MDGKSLLEKHFQLQPEQVVVEGSDTRYLKQDFIYSIIDVTKVEQDFLLDYYHMSKHLIDQGDRRVSAFVKSKDEKFLVTEDKQEFVVLQNKYRKSGQYSSIAKELAMVHKRGRTLTEEVKAVNYLGLWRSQWEKRVDDLEKRVMNIIQQPPYEPFDTLVAEVFPYYMGLAENAIQYVADTEMDDQPLLSDYGTVCHRSFHEKAWGNQTNWRNPFDLVFDHAGRDLSEWIRSSYWDRTLFYQSNLQNFLQDYQQIEKLSPFSWRLIYARLLFPSHFFDCVDQYFSSASMHVKKVNEDRLKGYVQKTREYERFLGSFYEMVQVPVRSLKIPEIIWLK
ncbi:spore coat protein YutH [Bacillus ectoiniformans]|uniref:spore coat putative kinase YutH n=1 Tax=Bacillus ectoiniformans TaxID=1494429 RepID=UPI00195F1219|nr:spore coat protein YutH [Bacillus ectoiniformans]MBM7648545.1 spore coat protein YutH [Bacillus ectoiniformans]